MEGLAEKFTLPSDHETGVCTRLPRFLPGAETTSFGENNHKYPEEVFIISGRLDNQAFELWLEGGYDASRPPVRYTGRSLRTSGVWFVNYLFPIKTMS